MCVYVAGGGGGVFSLSREPTLHKPAGHQQAVHHLHDLVESSVECFFTDQGCSWSRTPALLYSAQNDSYPNKALTDNCPVQGHCHIHVL